MSESKASLFAEALRSEIKEIVREVIREELTLQKAQPMEKDKLLTPNEAAALMGVNRRWLYRHAGDLPFTRRFGRKTLRFSEAGLRRWIAAKKPDSPR